jgi:methionine biosynthesis protein MetW
MNSKRKNPARFDLDLISKLIAPDTTVLDLGCGSGDLLHKLMKEKRVRGHGVEFDHQLFYACVEKGVPVISANLDEGLSDYPDKSFDYVILSKTIQVVRKPHLILKEMLRVGVTGIVSVPNFGYWKVRLQLLALGKMPKTASLPYEWYDTPNIHLTTIKDFKDFCKKKNIRIKGQYNLISEHRCGFCANALPNLFAEMAIFVLQNGVQDERR